MSGSLIPHGHTPLELNRIFLEIERRFTALQKNQATPQVVSDLVSQQVKQLAPSTTITYAAPKGRKVVEADTPPLGFYQTGNLEIPFTESCDMIRVESDHPAWIKVYGSADARTLDSPRPYTKDPTPGTGLMGEVATYPPDYLGIDFSPVPFFNNLDPQLAPTAYLAVTSMDPSYTGPIHLIFTVLPQEQVSPSGPQGKPGPAGKGGDPGSPGMDGVDGRTVLVLDRDPAASDGQDGDACINRVAWTIFAPKAGGAWPAGVSLVGPDGDPGDPGADGNTVLYGAVDPGAGVGVDGNFYINTATHYLFGPKAAGAWPAGVSLVGPAGGARDCLHAYLGAAANSPANVSGKIPMDSVSYDTGGIWNSANKRAIPTKAGYYLVNLRVRTSTSGGIIAQIGKNGAVVNNLGTDTSSNFASGGSDIVYCNGTTDYLEGWAWTNAARAYTTGTYDTWMSVLGPM